MRKIYLSWQLFVESFFWFIRNKKILFFSALSLASASLKYVFISLVFYHSQMIVSFKLLQKLAYKWYFWAALLIVFGISNILSSFFNMALVAYIDGKMRNQPTTIAGALRVACSRWFFIVWWVLIGGFMNFFISVTEGCSESFRNYVIRFIGQPWSRCKFFFLPAVVLENTTPLQALRRSAALLNIILQRKEKETFTGLGWILFILFLVVFVFFGLEFIAPNKLILYCIMGFGLTYFVIFLVISQILNTIFSVGLYTYVSSKTPPKNFSKDLLDRVIQ